MRELIYKNLITPGSKKRDVSVEEIVEKNGLISSTMKRSMYFIRGVHHIKTKEDLKEWIERRKKNANLNKKYFHILRKHSSENKEDKLICKMRGAFYVVAEQSVYNIVFVHAIKIKVHGHQLKGN